MNIPDDPADPPAETVCLHCIPVIQRVSPKLSVRAEQIRRNSGNLYGNVLFIQPEPVRFCPDVCGIKRNIYRKITDNGDAGIICVCLQLCPLAIEQELYVFIHFHFFAELTSPFCAGLRSVQPYVLIRPLEPRA